MSIERMAMEALALRAGYVALNEYVTGKGRVVNYLINGAANYGRVKAIGEERTRAKLRIANQVNASIAQAKTRALLLADGTKADQGRYKTDAAYLNSKWDAVVESLTNKVIRIEQGNHAAPKAVGGDVVLPVYVAHAPGVDERDGRFYISGTYVNSHEITPGRAVLSGDQTKWKKEVDAWLLSEAIKEDDGIRDLPLWLKFTLKKSNFTTVRGNGVTITPADL